MDRLIEKIIEKRNPTVVGLDPRLEYIPQDILDDAVKKYGRTFEAAGVAIWRFNKLLIDSFYDLVPAIKPQSAYYEMYGVFGLEALRHTCAYAAEKGLYVILDAKRGDIGPTAEAYASAYLGGTDLFGERADVLHADSLTVNAYLGSDGVLPFVKAAKETDKSIFCLVKTSNRSSGEFQDLSVNGKTVFRHVGVKVSEWNAGSAGKYGYGRVGAVVGATYPEQLVVLRREMPDVFFLIPGYGAQGGSADDLAPAFTENGLGAIVNSSRAIMCAYKNDPLERGVADSARAAVLSMQEDINGAIMRYWLK